MEISPPVSTFKYIITSKEHALKVGPVLLKKGNNFECDI